MHFVLTLCLLLPQFFFLSPRPVWGSITSQCSALCSDTEDGLWLRKCARKTPVRGICRDGGPLKVDLRQKATLTALSSTLVCGRSIPLGSFSVREHNLSASPSSAQIFTRSSSARSSAAPPPRHHAPGSPLFVILMLTSRHSADESAAAAADETSSQKSTPDVFISLKELKERRLSGL